MKRRCFAVLMLLFGPAAAGAQLPGQNIVNFRAVGMDVTIRYREDRLRQMDSQFRPVLIGALERYTELFGGRPRGQDGHPLAQLTVHVQSDPLGAGDAEVGVIHLLVARQPLFGFYDWRLVLLHEAFHLWSAQSFRFAGPAEQWFNEGTAEFYALQTAARMELVDDITTIRNAATMVGFYTSAADQDRMSLTEAGQQKSGHHFLIHHGGFTAALMLDRTIRGRTAGAKSLDDVMRWLYATFDRETKLYTSLDIARGLREAAGHDAGELFAKSIMGRLPLSLSPVANLGELARGVQAGRAGMRDVPPPDQFLAASLGIAGKR
ncbi:MAG TPA: hypothetical protein VFO66_04220 [Gemmatimonadaceae bacterium]|nr:hypothetical protein [Gemmatimonadaceae bacterium]